MAYDGRIYLADTSVWSFVGRPGIREDWTAALLNRQIATCPIVKLELLYEAREGADYDRRDDPLGSLRDIPITRSVTNAALAAFRRLAHASPLGQRGVKLPDVLIAAAALDASVGVLHYDAHFDRLAEVLDFESRWIAPAGSL
ncbi:MAG: PIN domain-containing protein [Gaiellaceae bacterium]